MITGHPGHKAGALVVPLAGVIACGVGGSESGTQSHGGGGRKGWGWERWWEKRVWEEKWCWDDKSGTQSCGGVGGGERKVEGKTGVWGETEVVGKLGTRARLNLVAGVDGGGWWWKGVCGERKE